MRKVKKIVYSIALIFTLIITTNFIINVSYVYKYQNITENAFSEKMNLKKVNIYISNDSIALSNCHDLKKDERIALLCYIKNCLRDSGVRIERSINNLEAELILHSLLYKAGLFKSHTEVADLEFDSDPRWYVNTGVIFFQILGI